jgi:dual specificity protein kinase YAK1
MLNTGKQTSQFFDSVEVWNPHLNQNEKKYRLKSLEQYSREHNTNEQPGKQYFKATTLPEIINLTPMPTSKSSRQGHELDKGNVTLFVYLFAFLIYFFRIEQSSSVY